MKNDFYLTVLRTVAGRMCELAETGTEMDLQELTVLTGSLQFSLNEAADAWRFQVELESEITRLSREVRQNEAMIDQLHLLMARWTDAQGMNGAIGPAAGEAVERVEAAETALEAVLAEMGRQMPAGGGA